MWQAQYIADQLTRAHPGVETSLVSTATFGDRQIDKPISAIGGKGAFSKEIQQLILDDHADIAVHSAKDLQAVTPDGLSIAAYSHRLDASDALLGTKLADLPLGAAVATGSARRRALLLDLRPDLELFELRGNIGTRIKKLEYFDAIVMATVAIERIRDQLDTPDLLVDPLDVETFVPQVGQGALAVEVRSDDTAAFEAVSAINHQPTATLVAVERQFLVELGADCSLPAGAHAVLIDDGGVEVCGVLADKNEQNLQRALVRGAASDNLGCLLGQQLVAQLEAIG